MVFENNKLKKATIENDVNNNTFPKIFEPSTLLDGYFLNFIQNLFRDDGITQGSKQPRKN